jgi:hypothetical protein
MPVNVPEPAEVLAEMARRNPTRWTGRSSSVRIHLDDRRTLVIPHLPRLTWGRKPGPGGPGRPRRPGDPGLPGESHSRAGRHVQVSRIALLSRSSVFPGAPARQVQYDM